MSKKPYCNSYTVYSLGEFFQALDEIQHYFSKPGQPETKPLWFRGHVCSDYELLPSLFRQSKIDSSQHEPYMKVHTLEQFRIQTFHARTFSYLASIPQNQMDWLEVMQHHSCPTRLIDWSEIVQNALFFALSPFIDPNDHDELEKACLNACPVIWVLDPVRLNQLVIKALLSPVDTDTYPLLNACFDMQEMTAKVKRHIKDFIQHLVEKADTDDNPYFLFSNGNTPRSLHGLINISYLLSEIEKVGVSAAEQALKRTMNPFLFLLKRLYCDGIPVDIKYQLPPLATIHPYHSKRIASQYGAFTCCPIYCRDHAETLAEKSINATEDRIFGDCRTMERFPALKDCLFEIRIRRPSLVARQLLEGGMRYSHMYPDVQEIVKDAECKMLRF